MNTKQKVLILGSTGMLGHVVYSYLNEKGVYEITDISYRTKLHDGTIVADIRNEQGIAEIIKKQSPQFVINCIGILIKGSNENPANAIYVNSYFPHALSKICDEAGAKLITVSTDCVFSGKKGHYAETDFPDADDVYGRSKALGELKNGKDVTLRTSIIGPELKKNGEGLFHWLMSQKGSVNGFTNMYWSGLTTLELAKFIGTFIDDFKPGLYQLSYREKISKYDLVSLMNEIFQKGLTVEKFESKGVDKSLVPSPGLKVAVNDYRTMIHDLYQYMKLKKDTTYLQYF